MNEKFVMPWEERPADCKEVMWRYSKNPVIGRYQIPSSNSIFNSAVVPFKDGFAGVFRCDNRAVQMNIFAGFSKDGINWEINHEPIVFKPGNTEMIDSEYNMTLVSLGLKTVTGLHGATVITDLPSVSVIHSISRNSISARMPSFHLTVTAYCSRRKLTVSMPC